MTDYLKSFEFTSMLAMFTYWVPMTICVVVYLFRGGDYYRIDLIESRKKYYTPSLKLGVIVWWILLAVTPCVNLLALVFDCASSVFRWLGRVLDFPLVKAATEAEKDHP